MVMTGFLPSHSIETPLPEEKIDGKAEAMRTMLTAREAHEMALTLMFTTGFAEDEEMIKLLMEAAGYVVTPEAVAVMRRNEAVVKTLLKAHPSAVNAIDKDRMLNLIESVATRYRMPVVTRYGGQTYRYTDLRGQVMNDLEIFVDWVEAVVSRVFDVICEDACAAAVTLQAINFDVPTERPLEFTVATADEEVWHFEVPWFGRRVIARDSVAFIMHLMIEIASELYG